MNTNQHQMTLRTASDNEHSEITKQLMEKAKKPAIAMGGVCILVVIMIIAGFIHKDIIKGADLKSFVVDVFMSFLCAIMFLGFFGYAYILPYYKLCKRKYYIADCVVTNVRSSSDSDGGRNYYATISYTDSTSIVPVEAEVHAQTEVPIQTSEIFRKAAPGTQAVVVFITQKIPIPYSLCVL